MGMRGIAGVGVGEFAESQEGPQEERVSGRGLSIRPSTRASRVLGGEI